MINAGGFRYERQLHAFILSSMKDYDIYMEYADGCLPYIEDRRLDTRTHNKATQKSVKSYRITPEQKKISEETKNKKLSLGKQQNSLF